MFFYIFLFISNFFLAVEAKNSDHITSIDDLNNIGFFEWGRDILNSNKKKQEIIDLFQRAKNDEVIREEIVSKISGWGLANWLHGKVNSKNEKIISAYADFRDSLTDEQLSRLNWKMYIYLGKFIGSCSASYIALVGLLTYIELKTKQAEKKISFSAV